MKTASVFELLLHPGVGRAGELVRPVGRPPRGGVEVHVVGVGFESERLAGVAVGRGRGQVGRLVLVVLVSVALWGRQVHSVAVVVLPVGFVVKWLCVLGAKRAGVKSAPKQSQQKVSVRKIRQKSRRSQIDNQPAVVIQELYFSLLITLTNSGGKMCFLHN